MPIWQWSLDDVASHIHRHGLRLPAHYAEFMDSLECLCCPATVSAERLAYLDRHHPEAAAFVRPLIRQILDATGRAATGIEAALVELVANGAA
jgi:3'-phosphoadenosine 5'-phosphosulfate sulfotransferase (PAPS reductase)/FAD synthetase